MVESVNQTNNTLQDISPEDISILMPVYNHADTLEEAMDSALMQQMPFRSVIYCFDDASTDRSSEILSYYARNYPQRVRVYTNHRNLGKGKESYLYHRPPILGRYWCILAGDDYWTSPQKLNIQISYLDSNPEFVGCSCDSLMTNEVTGERNIIKPDRNTWNLYDLINLKNKYAFYVHTTSIIWRNIYLDQGFFLPPLYQKPHIWGDVILMHLMLARGGKVRNIDKVMSCYRYTGRGIWSRKTPEEQASQNKEVQEIIKQTLPLKHKLFSYLHDIRKDSTFIKRIIPGTVNE